MVEEALKAGVPFLVIDVKVDLPNLLLRVEDERRELTPSSSAIGASSA